MDTIFSLEKDARDARILSDLLKAEYRVIHCSSVKDLCGEESGYHPSAVLVDLDTNSSSEIELLRGKGFALPVIVLGTHTEPSAVLKAVNTGAVGYVPKPLNPEKLRTVIRKAIAEEKGSASPFTGHSAAIQQAFRLIKKYARYKFPVLIAGESGTGKEIAARALHELSKRAQKPFIARNCAALPENLIESELFGSVKGAFTGAVERPGAFQLAEGGTLFLDEIGELALSNQAKLLRVLESGEYWKLGAGRAEKCDVRLISATWRHLDGDSERMRPDLLSRINTLILPMPALRERREDIPELAETLLRQVSEGGRHFTQEALELLRSEEWPGNIRQLRNVVSRALVLADGQEEIGPEHIVLSEEQLKNLLLR